MSRTKLNMSTLAEITTAISHYQNLINYLGQLDKTIQLKEFYDKVCSSPQHWGNINLFVVEQTWGNTSCGWQTIGGSAMTDAYTVIIENPWYNAIYVYYDGELAYIAEYNDFLTALKVGSFRVLPGMQNLENLKIVYKKT